MPRPSRAASLRAHFAARLRHAASGSPARLLAALAGAGLLVLAPASRADIYRTEDGSGVISFTSRPINKGSELVARTKPSTAFQPVMPRDTSPERFSRYDAHIRQAAALYQIPEELIRAVIKVESNFDPGALSPKNARGLMQMIPATAQRMMVTDVFDPRQNIFGGTRYLRVLANLFNGDLELTVAAYNAGEGAVMRHGGIPPFEETRNYVTQVLAYYRHYRSLTAAQTR
jgi:soluble lytic murein transglycosylase-like protein